MKAADYRGNMEFEAFLSAWIRDRRCSLAFVDWLLEHDLPTQAEAARWAATQPERNSFTAYIFDSEDYSGPFPEKGSSTGIWYWFPCEHIRHANCVPEKRVSSGVEFDWFSRFDLPTCLVVLLDNWREDVHSP